MVLSSPPPKPFTVSRDGFSLNAAVACRAEERKKLERVCRYLLRPPVTLERLSVDGDGLVVDELKHPYADGTTLVLFAPLPRSGIGSTPEATACSTTPCT